MKQQFVVTHTRGAPKGGGCSSPPPKNPQNTGFVDIISEVLHDLAFSRNQPLKSADD
jgi:hypothetical protein